MLRNKPVLTRKEIMELILETDISVHFTSNLILELEADSSLLSNKSYILSKFM